MCGLNRYFTDLSKAQSAFIDYIHELVDSLENAMPNLLRMQILRDEKKHDATDSFFRYLSTSASWNKVLVDRVLKFMRQRPDLCVVLKPEYQYAKRLSILVLDGGGFRGYASLKLLEHIMQLTAGDRYDEENPLRPCQVFDLICGTSTGGLIALLLGRLGLTVPEAIDAYLDLGPKIFGDEGGMWKVLMEGRKFDPKPMEEAFAKLLERVLGVGGANAPLRDEKYKYQCRTFVTTAPYGNAGKIANPFCLRTYAAPPGSKTPVPGHKWTIIEAARATSAAPTYFPPFDIHFKAGFPPVKVQDAGGSGFNNPSGSAWWEINHCPAFKDIPVGLFVSLGTGLGNIVAKGPDGKVMEDEESKEKQSMVERLYEGLKKAALKAVPDVKGNIEELKKIAADLVDVATNTEAQQFVTYGYFEKQHGVYYRFNPSQGLGEIDLADFKKVVVMDDIINAYTESEAMGRLKECANSFNLVKEKEIKQALFEPQLL